MPMRRTKALMKRKRESWIGVPKLGPHRQLARNEIHQPLVICKSPTPFSFQLYVAVVVLLQFFSFLYIF